MTDKGGKKISCEVCQKEISESSKAMSEVADYAYYFCSTDCQSEWNEKNPEIKNLSQLISKPDAFFQSPAEILYDTRLSKALKLKILKSWKNFSIGMQRADDENMRGENAKSNLRDIEDAMIKLREDKY